MTRKRSAGWFGLGFLLGRFGVLGTLGVLVGVVLAVPVLIQTLLIAVPAWFWWLCAVGALAAVAWWVRSRRELGPGRRLTRTVRPTFFVYHCWEWRREDGALVPPFTPGAVRHLVYIGKTKDLNKRLYEHQRERDWWHDWIAPTADVFFSERAMDAAERQAIHFAARQKRPELQPRENRMLNAGYDPRRVAEMRRRAVPA